MKINIRRLLKSSLLIFVVICIISCHKIHEGEVIDKYTIPAHKYKYTTTTMCGKVFLIHYHTGYRNEKFILRIKDKDNNTENFSVSQETYNCIIIGEFFNDTIPCEVYKTDD